jgi:hypothetical protein
VAVKAQQEQKQEQEQVKGNRLSVLTLFLNDQARLPRRVVRSDRPSRERLNTATTPARFAYSTRIGCWADGCEHWSVQSTHGWTSNSCSRYCVLLTRPVVHPEARTSGDTGSFAYSTQRILSNGL